MTKVIAALDNSIAAKPVLATALAIGRLLDAEPELIHVGGDGDGTARRTADAAELPLQTVAGAVLDRLLDCSQAEDVVAMVIGARGTPGGRRPLGSTALAVATSLQKPIVIVPPNGPCEVEVRRVLVPLEGQLPASLVPREIVALGRRAAVEVIVLHVHDEESLPLFTDQPQHERQAWAREFLTRHCPWGIDRVRLETRVGSSQELVPLVAGETRADLIVLGWAQELAEGRAPVVRAALSRCGAPVMLVPVGAPTPKEEPWSSLQSLPA
jgi:nucleotide-binding universal stress UspA family protein